MGAFDLGYSSMNDAFRQSQQIREQERLQSQNTIGAQLLDSINNASNIKPTTKDADGNDIPNPAYAQAQADKQKLLSQYVQLNSPEQHAAFGDRLHGLIFGHPTPQTQQPALSPNSSPVAPPASSAGSAPVGATLPSSTAPAHPFETNNPVLSEIGKGIDALGNHLKAFAHPPVAVTGPDAVNPVTMAQYYRDPAEVQFERNQALWGERGANALAVAQERTKALMASLQARPPRLLSQTTMPDLLEQMKIDPTMAIYGPNGQELSPAQLAEMPPSTIAREFRAGSQIFYALGDQNSKTLKVGNEVYDIPAIGQINSGNSTALGVANPGSTSTQTDPFGLKTTTQRAPVTTGITAALPAGPVPAGTVPTLQVRPSNPGARTPGTVPVGGAVKPKPISSAAPSVPSGTLPPLDANGHIPDGVGNPLVRQFANDLLDGKDLKDIPNPRARAAAEAMARPYGWEQGKFTPRELGQVQVFQTQLNKLTDPKTGFLSLYDEGPIKRGLVAKFLDTQTQRQPPNEFITALQSGLLNDRDENFITMFNQAVGRIQSLAQLTRGSGQPNTEAAVNRMMKELPYPNRIHSSAQAADALKSIQEEIDTAVKKKDWGADTSGPVSKNAPSMPNGTLADRLSKALAGK